MKKGAKKVLKKEAFNVFDGEVVHTIKEKDLTKFLKRFNNAVAVSYWKEEVSKVKGARIKIKTKAKNITAKTNLPKKNNRKVIAISKNNKRKSYNSIAECSKHLHIDDSNISKVLNGKRKTANGFTFRYA